VSVAYATADLTPDEEYWYGPGATAGIDYQAKSGTLTFAAGETSKAVTILVNGDRSAESYEYFTVNLSNPSGVQLSSSQGWGAIVDDEPGIYFTNGYVSAAVGNTGTQAMTFTVGLSTGYDVPVTVTFSTTDGSAIAGSDYVATSATVTFTAGRTSQTVSVPIIGDALPETDEYFYVQLSSATNGTIWNSSGSGTILDDDTPPTISVSDASISEGNSGTQVVTFTVSLSQFSGNGVSVNYTTANGSAKTSDSDYVAKSGTIYFAPGERFKTIEITVKGDTRKEQNERFYVNLSAHINATILDSQGIGTIMNDDGRSRGILET
jgi:hypothetical protein